MAPPTRTLLVLPDADRIEHALLEAVANESFVDARRFTTFARLVEACEPARQLGRVPCPPLTARLLLTACASKLERHPFGAWVFEPGFARQAQALIAQLKGQGATPADLQHAAHRLLDAAWKARTLAVALLWDRYEAALAAHGLADREDLLVAATRVLEKGLPPPLREVSQIAVRHLYDWPPARLAFLKALARACDSAGVAFTVDLPLLGVPEVDALVNEVMGAVERGGENDAPFLNAVLPDAQQPRRELVRRLFSPPSDPAEPPLPNPGVTAFTSATAIDEVGELARRVRDALDGGASPEAVAVVWRGLADEAEALVSALAELGVPARTRRGAPLESTAVGRLALGLPALVEERFPAVRVAHYLESRYARAVTVDFDPAPVFAAAGVRDDALGAEGSRGAWDLRLARHAARLDPKGAAQVKLLANRVQALKALCGPMARARTLSEHVAAWVQAVKKLELFEAVRARAPLDESSAPLARATEAALARDQAATEALELLAEDVARALQLTQSGSAAMSLAGFARWLGDAAGDVNLPARGARTGAVRVLEARELFGRPLTHLFFGGVEDGRLPARNVEPALLSEAVRGALNTAAGRPLFRLRAGEGDDRLGVREAEDRLVFAEALTAAPHLTLSCKRFDDDGRAVLPSPWLRALKRAIAGFAVEVLPLAAPPPLARVRSPRELRLRVALEALSLPSTRLTRVDPAAALLAPRFGAEPWFVAARDAARVELERLQFFSQEDVNPQAHSGAVHGTELAAVLARRLRFGPDAPLSVSRLSTWGNCAFQGFASELLSLEASEERGEDIAPRDRGTWMHAVLETLMPRLHAAGLLGKPLAEIPERALDEHLDAALDEAAERVRRRTHLGHPAVWPATRESARRRVLKLIDGDRATPFTPAVPEDVELRFGVEGKGLGPVTLPGVRPGETDVSLAGKIDRVDAGGGARAVLDYKSTVGGPTKEERELLKVGFQLPVYLHVLRATRGDAALAAGWQSLKDGKVLKLGEVLEKRGITLDQLLATDEATRTRLDDTQNLGNALHGLLGHLRTGDFGPRPVDCGYCGFKRVCRISQRKVGPREEGD